LKVPITVQGNPPHDLPFAESASAQAVDPKGDPSVELTLNVAFEGDHDPVPVRVRMTAETARGVASQMGPCATAAEVWAQDKRR
jgi:hypothetical protein